MTRVVILVPWRTDHGPRARLYAHVRPRLERLGYPIIEADSTGPTFSIAQAWNRAAQAAGDWDVALQWGADFLIERASSVHAAVRSAADGAPYVKCFDKVTKLSTWETAAVLDGCRHPDRDDPLPFGGPRAIRRDLFDMVGGYDERFQGWGHEDRAFVHTMTVLGATETRVPGRMIMLRHPGRAHATPGDPYYAQQKTNHELLREYQSHRTPKRLRAYLAALEGSHHAASR